MGRWVLILVGPLPATVLLLPFLFAGGLAEAIALGAALVDHRRSGAERWATVTTTGTILLWVAAAAAGVLALWVAVLAGPRTDFSQTPPALVAGRRTHPWAIRGDPVALDPGQYRAQL